MTLADSAWAQAEQTRIFKRFQSAFVEYDVIVYPYAFPRALSALLKYSRNTALDVRYHPNAMLKLAPFLWRYWRNSHPSRHAVIARWYATLIEHCVTEHRLLAAG
ncbi:D-amino acid dehydrogenase small subunit [Caballeronia sordidicola]|jgi:D-amino-acid dehydrogenase|uniref:D-amino acid dehydrogenase small subunit n=1 Tax=Caballeronia sordidicola TaxID=196367 RepID=A0A226WWA4_CABSO|nr:D-amino acid dehydrogenase small subunit [Caballeronia sordidicola]